MNPSAVEPRIAGIVLVRNEDRFVRAAVTNVIDFCDELLLVDHGSTDGTAAILRELAAAAPEKIRLHSISDPRESHELIKRFAGTRTWVFAVDGDEIYDAAGLARFRPRLLGGEFDAFWMVVGNSLHCDFLDERAGRAGGFLAPPSRSVTKLFNFTAIDRWDGDTPERLHGGRPEFRAGYHGDAKRLLKDEVAWDDSPFRCLHACFVPRSSLDGGSAAAPRLNIMETCGRWGRFRRLLARLTGRAFGSDWKRERYARGGRVKLDVAEFFPRR